MLTEKDYCDYDTCVALKELGFNYNVDWYFYPPSYKDSVQEGYRLCWGIPPMISEEQEQEYIPRVSLYEAQKWLREEKRICVEVDCCASGYVWELCKAYQGTWFSGGTTIYTHYCEDNENNKLLNDCGKYNTYEEALSEGIKEAIKILKEE